MYMSTEVVPSILCDSKWFGIIDLPGQSSSHSGSVSNKTVIYNLHLHILSMELCSSRSSLPLIGR